MLTCARAQGRFVEIVKLSMFIRQNKDSVLGEWEAFARTLMRGSSVDVAVLRDHAATMLDAIAADIESPQSAAQQADKSKGLQQDSRRSASAAMAAAEYGHGLAGTGFTVLDIAGEFRALRASVIRLWVTQSSQSGRVELDELIRFNEAIDEAIAYSLEGYVSDIEETRRRFLAILGHDLTNHLTAASTAASLLAEVGDVAEEHVGLVEMIQNATSRMDLLVADMLELAGGLGNGMPIYRSEVDIGELAGKVVAEYRAASPALNIRANAEGNLIGRWDGARLTQALTKLIDNAIEHGDHGGTIRVSTRGGEGEVLVELRNSGPSIPRDRLVQTYDGAQAERQTNGDGRHSGLGLFIVKKIIERHGGTMAVHSSTDETVFTIRLPRAAHVASVHERSQP